jgi:hypothetical protein
MIPSRIGEARLAGGVIRSRWDRGPGHRHCYYLRLVHPTRAQACQDLPRKINPTTLGFAASSHAIEGRQNETNRKGPAMSIAAV